MNENTNQETRMIEMTYCGGKYYAGTEEFACGQRDEPCRKCLKRHIARLEAALAKERIVVAQITNVMEAQAAAQAGGVVVVPEPTADEWRLIAENARSADMVDFLSGAASYGLWLRGKIPTAIPASRVLGELEAQAAAQPEKETQIGSSDSGYFRRELVSLLGRLLNADGPWLARYLRRLADVAEPTPTQAAAQAGGVMSPERIGAEELAVLREVVRLVAEARERYDKRPHGAGGQRMADEIDDLLCRLYEIGAHPALRTQATERGGSDGWERIETAPVEGVWFRGRNARKREFDAKGNGDKHKSANVTFYDRDGLIRFPKEWKPLDPAQPAKGGA